MALPGSRFKVQGSGFRVQGSGSGQSGLATVPSEAQREAEGAAVAGLADVEAGVARRGGEKLEVVFVEQIARPECDRPPARRAETDTGVHQAVARHDQVLRV